jgi:2-dehydro-3-deoxygluconokinase
MSDLVTFGETMLRLSPPGHERLETTTEFDVRAAGAESNAAVAAERLGAVTTWMSKLPDTPLGRRIVGELNQHDIDTDVVWSGNEDHRVGTYYMEHGGKPRGTNVVYDTQKTALSGATADEFDVDAIRDARAFYTTGITPALSSTLRDTVANLLGAARKAGTTTALDVNYRSKLWSPSDARNVLTKLFPAIDVLVLAERDASRLFDIEKKGPEVAHSIASRFDFTTVVITQGERGAVAWHDNVVHNHDAFETETVDPLGGGDAFTGAFLARRLSGDEVPRALEYAAATAALKRTIPGDLATVTKEEVEGVIGDKLDRISR